MIVTPREASHPTVLGWGGRIKQIKTSTSFLSYSWPALNMKLFFILTSFLLEDI